MTGKKSQSSGALFAAALLSILLSNSISPAQAHGGGLDASGCHNDRKRGGYHCHRGSVASPLPIARETFKAPTPVQQNQVPQPFTFMAQPSKPENVTVESGIPEVTIQPEKTAYWSGGAWRVFSYPDEDSCEIGVKPSDETYITVTYLPRDAAAYITVLNNAATSRADGETVSLDITFINKTSVTRVWDNTVFTVRVLPDGARAMVSQALGDNVLTHLSRDAGFTVMTQNGALVGGTFLNESAPAVEQLRKCAFEAAELNPKDPFMQK